MKNIIIFLCCTISLTAKIQAQTETPKQGYIVITQKIPQLNAIIKTAKSLNEENPNGFGTYEVIICGQAITSVTNLETMKPLIEKAKASQVTLLACGLSMAKFNIKPEEVPKEIKIVENGLLYNFNAQKKGALSITL